MEKDTVFARFQKHRILALAKLLSHNELGFFLEIRVTWHENC